MRSILCISWWGRELDRQRASPWQQSGGCQGVSAALANGIYK